jgi:hypothetical protein
MELFRSGTPYMYVSIFLGTKFQFSNYIMNSDNKKLFLGIFRFTPNITRETTFSLRFASIVSTPNQYETPKGWAK